MRTVRSDLVVMAIAAVVVTIVASALVSILPSSDVWQILGIALAVGSAIAVIPRFFDDFRSQKISSEVIREAQREADRFGVPLSAIEHPTEPEAVEAWEKVFTPGHRSGGAPRSSSGSENRDDDTKN